MARCPNPAVQECLLGKGVSCSDCPARDWHVSLWLLWRRLVQWLGLPLIVLVLMRPGVALADHNSLHDCPVAVAQAVIGGARGGTYYGTASRVTWTDGVYVCVFQGGQASSFFKSRNAVQYAAKDAAQHGAIEISQSTAAKIVGVAKKLSGPSGASLLFWVGAVDDPACWVYDARQRRTVNVCIGQQGVVQ
jgi:hypothetical protein